MSKAVNVSAASYDISIATRRRPGTIQLAGHLCSGKESAQSHSHLLRSSPSCQPTPFEILESNSDKSQAAKEVEPRSRELTSRDIASGK